MSKRFDNTLQTLRFDTPEEWEEFWEAMKNLEVFIPPRPLTEEDRKFFSAYFQLSPADKEKHKELIKNGKKGLI